MMDRMLNPYGMMMLNPSHIVWSFLSKYFYIILIVCVATIAISTLFYKAKHKLAHQFWYKQPVNFIKDNNSSIKIIDLINPKSTKWTNYKNISFHSLYDEDLSFDDIQTFIQHNYIHGSDCMYAPQHLAEYFKGHNHPIYVGIYKDKTSLVEKNHSEMIGCVSAYPLNIKAKNSQLKYVYYVDNLCVKLDKRGKNIAPQMIDTLHHHFRHNNDATKVSLFKREGHLSGYIVPLVCYDTSLYYIDNWFSKEFIMHASSNVLDITKQNINVLYNFLYNATNMDLLIFPELSNLECLIEAKQLFIKLLMIDNEVGSMYIFRDSNTLYGQTKCVECIASINNQKNMAFFVNGFYHVLKELYTKYNFKILQMEKLSHNVKLDNAIRKKWSSFTTLPVSWFFYNYIYPEQPPGNILILT